jgi:hypothetical protein
VKGKADPAANAIRRGARLSAELQPAGAGEGPKHLSAQEKAEAEAAGRSAWLRAGMLRGTEKLERRSCQTRRGPRSRFRRQHGLELRAALLP